MCNFIGLFQCWGFIFQQHSGEPVARYICPMQGQGGVEPKRKLRNQVIFAFYFLCPLLLFFSLVEEFLLSAQWTVLFFLFSIFYDLFLFFTGRKRLKDLAASSNVDKEPFLYGIWFAVEKAQNFGHFFNTLYICVFLHFFTFFTFWYVCSFFTWPVTAFSPHFVPRINVPVFITRL